MARAALFDPNAVKLLDETSIVTRWGDMDALGHVNNSVYFVYFEQARQVWLSKQKHLQLPANLVPVLAAVEAVYRRPIHYPQTIIVQSFSLRVGHSSAQLGHRILDVDNRDHCFTEGTASLVWIDRDSGRPRLIPDPMRQSLKA